MNEPLFEWKMSFAGVVWDVCSPSTDPLKRNIWVERSTRSSVTFWFESDLEVHGWGWNEISPMSMTWSCLTRSSRSIHWEFRCKLSSRKNKIKTMRHTRTTPPHMTRTCVTDGSDICYDLEDLPLVHRRRPILSVVYPIEYLLRLKSLMKEILWGIAPVL